MLGTQGPSMGSRLFEVPNIHPKGTDTGRRFRAALRWVARLVLVSIVGSWLFLYIDSVHQRRRAESLFADLRFLDFSTAGFAEVRDIMVRYGGHAMQSELQPWFPDPGDPMIDARGNMTFTGRTWPMCTPRSCTFLLQIMTRLPRIPLLDGKARFFIRLFLTSGSVRGLPMRCLKFETESWIEVRRVSGNIGWRVQTTLGTGTSLPSDMPSRLGETQRALNTARAAVRTTRCTSVTASLSSLAIRSRLALCSPLAYP
jgi:hypothetical protein